MTQKLKDLVHTIEVYKATLELLNVGIFPGAVSEKVTDVKRQLSIGLGTAQQELNQPEPKPEKKPVEKPKPEKV